MNRVALRGEVPLQLHLRGVAGEQLRYRAGRHPRLPDLGLDLRRRPQAARLRSQRLLHTAALRVGVSAVDTSDRDLTAWGGGDVPPPRTRSRLSGRPSHTVDRAGGYYRLLFDLFLLSQLTKRVLGD